VLVESRRVDGKPRQTIIKVLASVAAEEPGDDHGQYWRRRSFWERLYHVLAELERAGAMTPEQRDAVEEQVACVVPRLCTPVEMDKHLRVEAERAAESSAYWAEKVAQLAPGDTRFSAWETRWLAARFAANARYYAASIRYPDAEIAEQSAV